MNKLFILILMLNIPALNSCLVKVTMPSQAVLIDRLTSIKQHKFVQSSYFIDRIAHRTLLAGHLFDMIKTSLLIHFMQVFGKTQEEAQALTLQHQGAILKILLMDYPKVYAEIKRTRVVDGYKPNKSKYPSMNPTILSPFGD